MKDSTKNKCCINVEMKDKRIPTVDYLKGFSIFTIALMHLLHMMTIPSIIYKASLIGGTGVHIFFLCSGIGLYMSYLQKKTSYAEFLKKRFVKIYIPYFIVVVLIYLLPWMYEGEDRLTALLSHVFLFKMFVPRYEESFSVSLWFFSTIIQLYVVFIPLCLVKNKLKNDKLFFIIFLGVSVRWWIFCYLNSCPNQHR